MNTKNILRSIVHSRGFVPLILALLTLTLTGSDFLQSGTIPSANGADLTRYFVYCREFGAAQLRLGHLPLWNPHLCGGTPFAGNWQSALFYPPNWIYVFLPLDKALNFEIALHVFLTGFFMAFWAKRRGFHPLAQLLAGSMAALGGAYYLHIYAGHLSLLDACAWVPLLLLAVEAMAERPGAKWAMAGALALALEILAGHPQTVFNSLVAVLLYAPFLLWKSPQKGKTLALWAAACAGGLALSAAQLGVGFAAAGEGVRQGPIPYPFASLFSFIPRNLITLIVPGFYGDMVHAQYWGGWFLWEMSAFASVTGISLAIYALIWGAGERRRMALVWLFMAAALTILATGANTPLFRVLYVFLPGFNKFRGHSRFLFEALLFLALLAGSGLDTALKIKAKRAAPLVIALAGMGILCSGFGLVMKTGSGEYGDPAVWKSVLLAEDKRHGSETRYVPTETYRDFKFFNESREFAGAQCLLAGLVLFAVAGLFFALPKQRYAAHALAVLGVLELFWFAQNGTAHFKLSETRVPDMEKYVAAQPGDFRIAQWAANPNAAMVSNEYDIYGYEPAVIGRWAELMKRMQGYDPNDGEAEIPPKTDNALFRLLRCRIIFAPTAEGRVQIAPLQDPAPHLALADRWEVQTDRAAIYAAMQKPGVVTGESVVLEETPDPLPIPGAEKGTARIVAQTTDSLTIEAQTLSPVLLLITDAYSKDWAATALPGSAQARYKILPADYALRVIPLGAGTHRIKMEYAPPGYRIGLWVSLLSVGVFAFLTCVVWKSDRRARNIPTPEDAELPAATV